MTAELPTIAISIFDAASGRILKSGTFADIDEAAANCPDGSGMIEGEFDPNEFSVLDGMAVPRMVIPAPIRDGHLLSWPDPPPGLAARVYDLWIVPPHLLADTPLSGPDCGLYLVEGGSSYRIALSADFPWLPRTMEVSI